MAHAIELCLLGRSVLGHGFGRIRRLLLAVLEHGFRPGTGGGIRFLRHTVRTRHARFCSITARPW